jgi:hypothetical protein
MGIFFLCSFLPFTGRLIALSRGETEQRKLYIVFGILRRSPSPVYLLNLPF